jgi:hypothetical protein
MNRRQFALTSALGHRLFPEEWLEKHYDFFDAKTILFGSQDFSVDFALRHIADLINAIDSFQLNQDRMPFQTLLSTNIHLKAKDEIEEVVKQYRALVV